MDTSHAVVAERPKQYRQLRSNAEKRRIVEEALAGDVSVAAVARRHGINANLVFNWRRLYREGLLEQSREPPSATLVPVDLTRPAMTVAAPTPRATGGHIEIDLPGDVRVRVHGQVDTAVLAEVLTVLRSR